MFFKFLFFVIPLLFSETTLFCVHHAWQQMHLNVEHLNAYSHAVITFSVHLHLDVYLNMYLNATSKHLVFYDQPISKLLLNADIIVGIITLKSVILLLNKPHILCYA